MGLAIANPWAHMRPSMTQVLKHDARKIKHHHFGDSNWLVVSTHFEHNHLPKLDEQTTKLRALDFMVSPHPS